MKSPIPQLCATQAREPALLVSLLIGTNNLGGRQCGSGKCAHTPADVAAGVAAIAALVRERLPAARLLLVAVLPRTHPGDSKHCKCADGVRKDPAQVRARPGR